MNKQAVCRLTANKAGFYSVKLSPLGCHKLTRAVNIWKKSKSISNFD